MTSLDTVNQIEEKRQGLETNKKTDANISTAQKYEFEDSSGQNQRRLRRKAKKQAQKKAEMEQDKSKNPSPEKVIWAQTHKWLNLERLNDMA